MTLPIWMDRPAMIWDPQLLKVSDDEVADKSQPTCVYWKTQEWHSSIINHDNSGDSDAKVLCCVTYRDLLTTCAVSVAHLRRDLERFQLDDMSKDESIPIVVAIPEGPWLPLAILIVHALNCPYGRETSSNHHAVLVPVEPSEAMERNRRILQDIQPHLILCISEDENGFSDDMERMEQLSQSIKKEEDTDPCRVLNLATYVKEVLVVQDISDTFVDDFYASMEEELCNCDLQRWVSEAADFLTCGGRNASHIVNDVESRISHIVYTSGTTGLPKGCVSSIQSLQHYIQVKNEVYDINADCTIMLASAISFDPCLSDILATFHARAPLALAPRNRLLDSFGDILRRLSVTHVLSTPTLWSMVDRGTRQENLYPSLQVVALGGEPIPKQLRRRWARHHINEEGCRLFATYGVTEACVYQTAGEILLDDEATLGASGQYVGKAFRGLKVQICQEDNQKELQNVPAGKIGEIIVSGAQLDTWTGYWKRPELAYKFVAESSEDQGVQYHYRTGDRGKLDVNNGTLRILGRIGGEEGMVKVNGVRIELGEIEAAIVDEYNITALSCPSVPPVVVKSCIVHVIQGIDESSTKSEVHAYCVLSETARCELGLPKWDEVREDGLLVTGGNLLTLLRARCTYSLKAACIPNAFVILPKMPLSPTGKRNRLGLPPLSKCTPMHSTGEQATLLREYGPLGKYLAYVLCEFLNLQALQQEMLTTDVTLDMLGGDSLVATRVSRALYAWHHQVDNTRYLGGEYGKFDGPFDVVHLLRAKSLGDYVDMLERHDIGCNGATLEQVQGKQDMMETKGSTGKARNDLYDALIQTTTNGQSSIGIALLYAGADPNFGDHGKRLGKISGGMYHRKFAFHSSPLHLACKQGDDILVLHLLAKGAKYKSPDASGLYPLHLAASNIAGVEEEEERRLRCVQYLLEAGALMVMKDGNQQTVLHAAARSGHSSILRHAMTTWKQIGIENLKKTWDRPFVDWLDRWHRSPVHWTILNGRLDALQTVLELGCNPVPFKPKVSKKTSAAMEYPMELCDRLYPVDCSDLSKRDMGNTIRGLLLDAIAKWPAKDIVQR